MEILGVEQFGLAVLDPRGTRDGGRLAEGMSLSLQSEEAWLIPGVRRGAYATMKVRTESRRETPDARLSWNAWMKCGRAQLAKAPADGLRRAFLPELLTIWTSGGAIHNVPTEPTSQR